MTAQTIERLKANERYAHAGALAFILGHDCYYGCHYGMRSTLEFAREQYMRGWHDAEFDYRKHCC